MSGRLSWAIGLMVVGLLILSTIWRGDPELLGELISSA